ncbi:MAG TPA: DNA repair protein RecN [Pyrinomonadaceae bacterium]
MLTLLKIKNIALIDSLEVEFGAGLNLLTGETGSGKSIIVDSLGALTGDRVSADLIKEGETTATIEGLFALRAADELSKIFGESGVELDDAELIIRRELSVAGKNRVFVNNQLVTQSFLKRIGSFLVDIHGQGEQASMFDPRTHLEMLDAFAGVGDERAKTADAFGQWSATRKEIEELRRDESDKLQLVDILKFQVDEIRRANLKPGEDSELEDEKRRLNSVEKLTSLSDDAYTLLYEQDESTLATFDKAVRKVEELAEYDFRFGEYAESLATSRAVIEDLATTVRDFRNHLEFSPARLEEIENRLAEIARLARKYGGTIDTVLEHLAEAEKRLENIETAEFREEELAKKLAGERKVYLEAATNLHDKRVAAAARFEKEVETNLKAVALEKARFRVNIESADRSEAGAEATGDLSVLPSPEITNSHEIRRNKNSQTERRSFFSHGFDRVEFYFSANPGESPKPLVKVASGGEASRLMLILKTTAKTLEVEKSAVFDEIDAGIGGRVAEAVGLKLKQLARSQQVLCVTHQPQVASLADRHFVVEKDIGRNKTTIAIRELTEAERTEEIARMLAGEKITESARTHAAEMIAAGRHHFTAETQRRRGAGRSAKG